MQYSKKYARDQTKAQTGINQEPTKTHIQLHYKKLRIKNSSKNKSKKDKKHREYCRKIHQQLSSMTIFQQKIPTHVINTEGYNHLLQIQTTEQPIKTQQVSARI